MLLLHSELRFVKFCKFRAFLFSFFLVLFEFWEEHAFGTYGNHGFFTELLGDSSPRTELPGPDRLELSLPYLI